MQRQVLVVPPDPTWPDAYRREADRIAAALASNFIACHHVGSTSIPDIYAKPVIDILAEVADIEAVDGQPGMLEIGYEGMGEFGLPGRRFFRKDDSQGLRTHHVHTYVAGTTEAHRHIAFRDFMRAHPALARDYSDLKRRLAAEHPTDIEAYMDGKDPFIKEMERRALSWARR